MNNFQYIQFKPNFENRGVILYNPLIYRFSPVRTNISRRTRARDAKIMQKNHYTIRNHNVTKKPFRQISTLL